VEDQGGAYQTEDEARRDEHNQQSGLEALSRGDHAAGERYRASAAVLCRSGRLHARADEIQLDLLGDYKSNVALYPTFQNYFRTHKPRFLAGLVKERSLFPAARC
jgi:hypothetical protein